MNLGGQASDESTASPELQSGLGDLIFIQGPGAIAETSGP